MTRDDIIRMAEEASGDRQPDGWGVMLDHEQLERFAALVAAAEREACLNLCYTIGGEFKEEWAEHKEDKYWERCLGAEECAEALRTRGRDEDT